MSGAGLRRHHREQGYTRIWNDVSSDESISYKALGLLAYLLSKPDGWDIRSAALAKPDDREGLSAVRSGLHELARRGYYRLERRRLRDGTFAMGTAVADYPVPEWAADYKEFGGKPVPVRQSDEGSFVTVREGPTTEIDMRLSDAGEPDAGEPDTGEPGPRPAAHHYQEGEPGLSTSKSTTSDADASAGDVLDFPAPRPDLAQAIMVNGAEDRKGGRDDRTPAPSEQASPRTRPPGKRSSGRGGEHASKARELAVAYLDACKERGSPATQGFGPVVSAIKVALGNGCSDASIRSAVLTLAREGRPVTGGTLAFARGAPKGDEPYRVWEGDGGWETTVL